MRENCRVRSSSNYDLREGDVVPLTPTCVLAGVVTPNVGHSGHELLEPCRSKCLQACNIIVCI